METKDLEEIRAPKALLARRGNAEIRALEEIRV